MDFKEIKENFGDCMYLYEEIDSYTVDSIVWLMDRVEELEAVFKIKVASCFHFKNCLIEPIHGCIPKECTYFKYNTDGLFSP